MRCCLGMLVLSLFFVEWLVFFGSERLAETVAVAARACARPV